MTGLDTGLERGQPAIGVRCALGQAKDADAIMMRWHHLLAIRHQLLVELLARGQASEDNLDILVGLEAREPYHLASKIRDADGLPHLQDEDLAAVACAGALEDELN